MKEQQPKPAEKPTEEQQAQILIKQFEIPVAKDQRLTLEQVREMILQRNS